MQTHELNDLKGERNYRGCLVKRIIGGYQIWGINCSTPQEVDEQIEKASSSLNESIWVVPNNGNIATTNTQDFENGKS